MPRVPSREGKKVLWQPWGVGVGSCPQPYISHSGMSVERWSMLAWTGLGEGELRKPGFWFKV